MTMSSRMPPMAATSSLSASLRSPLSLGRAIARLPASLAIPAHLLRVRDRFADQMRIGHVDDGELGQVAGGGNLDGPDPEQTIDEALHDVHRADVPERYRVAVLAQDSLFVEEIAVGDGDRGRARLDVPNEQDEDAGAEGGDQQDGKDEPEGMGPEHGRVRLVNHLVRHPRSLSLRFAANLSGGGLA